MGCCLGVIAVLFPRVALFAMWLMEYTAPAFRTNLWPLLGFLFMPYTTCGYAIAMNEVGGIDGAGLALVILGVILDVGSHGGGAASGRRFRRTYVHYDVKR